MCCYQLLGLRMRYIYIYVIARWSPTCNSCTGVYGTKGTGTVNTQPVSKISLSFLVWELIDARTP
jgi:hypothetical protein